MGLLMVWLSRRFIDETIRTGTNRDVITMVCWLVLTVVGGVLLRQVYFLLTTKAGIHQTNTLRLRIFSSLFRRQLYDNKEMHSGDVSSRLTKDIELVSDTTTDTLPQMCITCIQLIGAFLLLHYFDRWLAWALLIMTSVDIEINRDGGMMALEYHGDLLKRCVAGPLAYSVYSHLNLTGTVQDTAHGVGGRHTQVVVTVG